MQVRHTPQVSIGMPVWNGEAFIRQGLESLLGQSFGDLEILVSDNASSDGTQAICEEYARLDPRVHYYRNETNTGLQANFARVMELATAPYFMWGCHDDQWDPQYVAKMVAILDSRGSVVLAGSNAASIDQHGVQRRWFDNVSVYAHQTLTARVHRFISAPPGEGHATLIYGLMRTPVIQSVGYLPRGQIRDRNRGYYAIDLITLFHLIFEGDFHVTDETLYARRDVVPESSGTPLNLRQRLGLYRIPRVAKSVIERHEYFGDLRAILRDAGMERQIEAALLRTTFREEARSQWAFARRLVKRRLVRG